MFFAGDKVRYVGHKFGSDLNTKMGVVIAIIQNNTNAVVVEFGDDTYVLNTSSVQRLTTNKDNVEVYRKRRTDDD